MNSRSPATVPVAGTRGEMWPVAENRWAKTDGKYQGLPNSHLTLPGGNSLDLREAAPSVVRARLQGLNEYCLTYNIIGIM